MQRGLAALEPQKEDQKDARKSVEAELFGQESQRRELLEVLDRIVVYEHYYHSVYGHFTKILNRVGYLVPKSVAALYEIRVAEATTERLLVNALSEVYGKTSDVVSVDQDFKIHANFPLPKPRAEFLRYRAQSHLRQLWEVPAGRLLEEPGIFKGYFRYEVRKDSRDQKIAFAVGIRHPVLGLQLEYGPVQAAQDRGEGQGLASELFADLTDYSGIGSLERTGQRSLGAVMSSSEEAFLAQRIFRGEMGRYAKSWAELSRITSFDFEEREGPRVESALSTRPALESGPIEPPPEGALKTELEIEHIR